MKWICNILRCFLCDQLHKQAHLNNAYKFKWNSMHFFLFLLDKSRMQHFCLNIWCIHYLQTVGLHKVLAFSFAAYIPAPIFAVQYQMQELKTLHKIMVNQILLIKLFASKSFIIVLVQEL